MEPNEVLRAMRSHWRLAVAGVVVGLAAAFGVTKAMTPQYTTTSRMFVSAAATDATAAYTASLLSEGRIASYSQILTSQELAGRVVDTLRLPMTPAQLTKKIAVSTVPSTVILDVTVTDDSPTRARDIAAALDSAFITEVTNLEKPAGATVSPIKVSVLQPPQVSTHPSSPNEPLILGIGAALGLLAGFLLGLVRHRRDRRVRTGEDVVRATGVDLLGTVRQDPRLTAARPVTVADERSVSAEAFRAIRTNLRYLPVGRRPKTLVVSGPSAGTGTTTLSLNLAAALGYGGSRVLLVESDLRHPSLARTLELPVGPGLTDVLLGHAQLSEATRTWDDGRVDVLAAGSTHARPSDVFGSARMRTLMQEMRDSYDFVLIDTSPLLATTDATVLSVLADGCLLTARYGRTRRDELTEAVALLHRLHVQLLGVVLNGVPGRAGRGSTTLGFAPAPSRATAETEPNVVIPVSPPVPRRTQVAVPSSATNGRRGMP